MVGGVETPKGTWPDEGATTNQLWCIQVMMEYGTGVKDIFRCLKKSRNSRLYVCEKDIPQYLKSSLKNILKHRVDSKEKGF